MEKPKKSVIIKNRADKLMLLGKKTASTLKTEGPVGLVKKTGIYLARYSHLNRLFSGSASMHANPMVVAKWYRRHGRSVTIVIPSHNDLPYLRKCLASIYKTVPKHKFSVIIVDDYCQEPIRQRLAQLAQKYPGSNVVFRKSNGGFAKAVNTGMRAADKRRDVVLLNSDTVAKKGWLAALQYGAYKHDKRAGLVGGKLLYPDGTIQYGGSHRNLDAPEWFDHYYRFRPSSYGPANVPWPVIGVTGACMYIKRAVISKIGYMDEKFGMAYEDMDYSLRAWKAGWRSLYFPLATLIHHESKSRGREQGERELAAQTYFWRKWGDWLDKRNVKTSEGKIKVIYVLYLTGMSGGIRIVIEHINRLMATGKYDIELYSLDKKYQSNLPLNVRHRMFKNYQQLLEALEKESAIKVATWWETNLPVWLASVKRGVAVSLTHEIESSFYAHDPILQHVAEASYRKEFIYLTSTSYTQAEIADKVGNRAQRIACAINLKEYHPLSGVKRRGDVLLALGRGEPLKNFPMTLAGWKAMGEGRPQLWLFGIEPHIIKYEKNITYFYKPGNAEVNKLYNQATVFVQTSRHEGFCLTALEAMAAGCPVVMTDAHGNRDYFKNGKNCLIVNQNDAADLAAKLTRLFGDAKLQERLRQGGYRTAARYDWPQIIAKLETFYTRIANHELRST